MQKKRLKIAVLIWDFVTTGGAERYACEVTRRLAREHEVHVFCQSWDPAVSSAITFHRIPNLVRKPSFIRQLLFSFFTRRALDDSFDIIHTHDRVTRFDLLTIHCPCYRGFITDKKTVLDKIMVWLSVLTSPRSLAYLWIEKQQFTLRPDRRLIAVSETVQKDVQANYALPDSFFSRAWPGVDLDLIEEAKASADRAAIRREHGLEPHSLAILFVGTEFRRKGLDTLLEAIRAIDRDEIRLVVAGGGGGQLEKYRQKVRALDLQNRVFFAGLVRDIFPLYAMADLFVLPTRSDPCPMSPVEAMASGVATIMSRAPFCGTAEHVRNGEALILDDPADVAELTTAIGKCLDPLFRRELAEKGENLARGLSWEKTTKETLEAYRILLAERDKRRP